MAFEPDPLQSEVLDHAHGALLVTGGPGTGKTAVLRERFARLIEAGADPERVALVVGSKRARDEARAALLERLRRPLPSLKVMTVHGLAFRVVGHRYAELGYREPPAVLTAADQFAKVQDLLCGEDPAQWPAYGRLLGLRGFADQVRQFVLRAQEALRKPEDILAGAERAGLTGWRELAGFYRRYLEVLDAGGEVDFAGLVEQAAAAAEDGEPLLDHLLVDDYQDTTYAAEALILRLGAGTLAVAGNLDAHVFSFQGTTDEPLRRFTERVPTARHVELGVPHRGADVSIEAWCSPHTSEEHRGVARELQRVHVEEGVPWRELAVVVRRQGPHLGGLLRELDDAGIPREVPEGGLALGAEPATVAYVLALRWIAHPAERDDLIEPVLTSELGGISPAIARGLVRAARAVGDAPADALSATEGLLPDEIARLADLRAVLEDAERAAAGSVLDAFALLWRRLPYSARVVAAGDASPQERRDLDAVVALSRAVTRTGESADPSVAAFLETLEADDEGLAAAPGRERDAVQVLTAHGATGLDFDTVLLVGAVEGDFPSLTRPEPMFDLTALERPISQSERNRLRLADERRLFHMVLGRARRRVLLTASAPHGEEESARSRFIDERGVPCASAPAWPLDEPVSVAEAAAVWRRTLADLTAAPPERLAAIDGLLALGVDPARWWLQRDWTDAGAPLHEQLYLSYSRLDTLENCELQFVLAEELGLARRGGYQAWVGKTVHGLIEDCEAGRIERSLEALRAELNDRWDPGQFPSIAISEGSRRLALERILPNWVKYFAESQAVASEVRFSFEFDGATINGVIDRIGPHPSGGYRITDFKTGKADKAPKAKDSLQLGIYYLAVNEAEELAPYRPVRGVDLAYLAGSRRSDDLEWRVWPVSPAGEDDYQAAMRERLSGLIRWMRTLDDTGTYRPNPNAECFFCDFKTLCSLYPEGQPLFPVPQEDRA